MALTSIYDPKNHRHIVTQDFDTEAKADTFAFWVSVRPGIEVLSLEQRASGRWFVVYAAKEPASAPTLAPEEPPNAPTL